MNKEECLIKAIYEFNGDAIFEICRDFETEESRYEVLMKVKKNKKISDVEYEWFCGEWINNMDTFLEIESNEV